MFEVTIESLETNLENREFRDFLNSKPHPVVEMDESGYTFLDYCLYKFKRNQLKTVILKINRLIKDNKVEQFNLTKFTTHSERSIIDYI